MRRPKRRLFFLAVAFVLSLVQLNAQQMFFSFKYDPGQVYRLRGTSEQNFFLAGNFVERIRFENIISFEVLGQSGSWADLRANYKVLEKHGDSELSQLTQEHESFFRINSRGQYQISPTQMMPLVRGIPTFPNRPISPGEQWTAAAEEKFDLTSFNPAARRPIAVQFQVHYTYEGPVTERGKTFHKFKASYTPEYTTGNIHIRTAVDQDIYWDARIGQMAFYEDTYHFEFNIGDRSYTIRGRSQGEIVPLEESDVPDNIEDQIRSQLASNANTRNLEVLREEEGLKIIVENIEFLPDSNSLRSEEEVKLQEIAKVLKNISPENLILIEGHTANRGSAEGRKHLSELRASAVVDFLVREGLDKQRFMFRGWGSEKPLVLEYGEKERARNRRVEITILDH